MKFVWYTPDLTYVYLLKLQWRLNAAKSSPAISSVSTEWISNAQSASIIKDWLRRQKYPPKHWKIIPYWHGRPREQTSPHKACYLCFGVRQTRNRLLSRFPCLILLECIHHTISQPIGYSQESHGSTNPHNRSRLSLLQTRWTVA